MKDYHNLFVKLDTYLLADCFENFRNECLENYQVDPCYFVSTPGFPLDPCLKFTRVEIELLTNFDVILMKEEGIRGGITQAIRKYASANNKYMKNYDSRKLSSFLMYLDANNLYDWAMSIKLPLNNFQQIDNPDEIFTTKTILDYNEKTNDKEYLLEVDIEYPKHLHHDHRDLPFCPFKNKKFTNNTKYSEAIQIARKNNSEFLPKQNEKLLTTLEDKEKHVIQITSLKQALEHGVILKKVQREISFSYTYWLKPYIQLNTELRTNTKNTFEKDFFKLMNKSVFGKTMENVRARRDIKLVVSEQKRKLLTSQPNFHGSTIFCEELEAIEMKKTHILMNKPTAVGQSILDKSKELMYTLWYDVLKPIYKDKAKLLQMDTDGFVINIGTDNVFQDFEKTSKELLDTSGYDKNLNRPITTGLNKKVIGKIKDELLGLITTKFIAIRPKFYGFKLIDDNIFKEQKKCKGTAKYVAKIQSILKL